jgi:hypothetical protein
VRIDTPFQHGTYMTELAELRDRLKAARANPAQQGE